MKTYKKDFLDWAKQRNVDVKNNSPLTDLIPGDTVIYTNEFGVRFERVVLGFCKPDNGRCVYLDKDSYWFPVSPDRLTKEI